MTFSISTQQEAIRAAVDAALQALGWRTIISTIEHGTMWDRVVLVPAAGPVMIRVAANPTQAEMIGLASILAAQDFAHIILFSHQLPFTPPPHPQLSIFRTTSEINAADVEAELKKLTFATIG